jgi:hypothetical protein
VADNDEGVLVNVPRQVLNQANGSQDGNVNGARQKDGRNEYELRPRSEMIEQGEEEQAELHTTLAKAMFLACDSCIYCGGKFVG